MFYWAWWIAYAPYVGLFVTRISRGRTIRQVIAGMLFLGSLGSWVFYMILGNFALFQQLAGNVDFAGTPRIRPTVMPPSSRRSRSLPFAPFVIGVFAIVALDLLGDDLRLRLLYTGIRCATLHLNAGDDPARWHRVFWAFALGLMPVTLMFIGGLKVLQVTLLIVSLPILAVCILAAVSLVKTLRADTA